MSQFSVEDYYPPEWSSLPMHSYFFEIIKEGNLLGKLAVRHKSFNLIGRLEDLCDMHIDNPMVSRKHAVLQAKKEDHHLYLMDLGSQHGTFVNKVKLPAHTYKKLEPFDSVKFGVSSRVYILRCPEYEEMVEQEQNQKENQFAKMLEKQHEKLSKEQFKTKYLDMLENDPYFAANQVPRKLTGKQQIQQEEDEYAGIDWGISDDREVYAYKNDNQMPIEPDLLRRLPLDSAQLIKLGQYEEHMRRYQEVESELNELASREKRQFGLEEKLRSKKEKMEKKFVEALQALEKCEDWLRTNIFGETPQRQQKNIQAIRQRENDTFGDDDFLDRTLEKKQAKAEKKQQIPDAEVYWVIEAKLKAQTAEYQSMKEKLDQALEEKGRIQPQQDAEGEQDELDLYMKNNQKEADDSNIQLYQREVSQLEASIAQLKQKLASIVGQNQVDKMIAGFQKGGKKTFQESYLDKAEEQANKNRMKKMEQNKNIEDILNKLESNLQNEEDVNEQDPSIFNYYKQTANEKEEHEELDQQQALERLRAKRQHYDPTSFVKPLQKMRKGNDHSQIPVSHPLTQSFEQEQEVDLTKQFN